MSLLSSELEGYLTTLATESSRDRPVLDEMEALASARSFPIIGRSVGRLVYVLATALGARRVLELGSGFGYSAYWFARAVGEEGSVLLTDFRADNLEKARAFLEQAGLVDRIECRQGDAIDIAKTLEGPFDIVFNDIDKERYPMVPQTARRLLRPGGLLISDNMLWYGRVIDPDPNDRATLGVVGLTRLLFDSEDFESVMIPLRDGVSVSVFKG
jgi:predicted O-methyltransferase YrrM